MGYIAYGYFFFTIYDILHTIYEIMSGLEVALIILVTIWSIIFIIVAVAVLFIFFQIKKAIDKVNQILQNAEDFTDRAEEFVESVNSPMKIAKTIGTLVGLFTKVSTGKKKK